MKTEIIAGAKPVNSKGRDMFIVITASGAQVWVTKDQYQADAETITYVVRKAGEEYTDKQGQPAKLKSDRNDMQAFGKQIVVKYSTLQLMDHLMSKGVTPAFNV